MTSDELSGYSSSVFLAVGDTPDYLYFLPRIIEVTLDDEFVWPDIEIPGRAIKDGGFESWPEPRRQALVSVFEGYLDEIIERKEFGKTDSLMCAAGKADISVAGFLTKIEKVPAAVLAFWEANAVELDNGKFGNAFWDLPNRQHDEIVKWFTFTSGIALIYAEAYGYRTS